MPQSETTPVLLKESQVEQAAEVLARALQNAPDMKFFIGDQSRQLEHRALRFYQAVIHVGLRYGEAYTTPSMDGVAVWVNPENANFTIEI